MSKGRKTFTQVRCIKRVKFKRYSSLEDVTVIRMLDILVEGRHRCIVTWVSNVLRSKHRIL